ncbi:hypothetical protein R1flu_011171 [Riccia fluitans]|uniref:AGC-kinase C-terminal domain-containing protein n=1 Tax=Riccia fluitans TaxID=41844 RepID=A0ABD1Z845_9MARC
MYPLPHAFSWGFVADAYLGRFWVIIIFAVVQICERERDVGSRTVKNVKGPSSKASSGSSLPVLIDVEDFKGTFSFDEFFKNLVYEVLPPVNDEDITFPNSANQQPPVANGAYRRSDSTQEEINSQS